MDYPAILDDLPCKYKDQPSADPTIFSFVCLHGIAEMNGEEVEDIDLNALLLGDPGEYDKMVRSSLWERSESWEK